MAKRTIAIVLMVLIAFVPAGCSTTVYEENYLDTYGEFLNYSLGDYSVEEEDYLYVNSPLPNRIQGTQWSLTYHNWRGEDCVFIFNNTESFAYQVVKHAEELAERYILEDVIIPCFPDGIPEEVKCRFRNTIDKSSIDRMLAPNAGLRLAQFTAEQLHHTWGDAISTYANHFEENVNVDELIPTYETYMRALITYLNDATIVFELDRRNMDDSLLAFYNPAEDTFTWRSEGEYIDEQNTVDGILMEVRHLYINGERLPSPYISYFYVEHNTYYVYAADVLLALEILDVEVAEIDTSFGTKCVWEMGGSIYTYWEDNVSLFQVDGDAIEFAGEKVGNGYQYIPAAVFAQVLDATWYYDETLRAIVLESNH